MDKKYVMLGRDNELNDLVSVKGVKKVLDKLEQERANAQNIEDIDLLMDVLKPVDIFHSLLDLMKKCRTDKCKKLVKALYTCSENGSIINKLSLSNECKQVVSDVLRVRNCMCEKDVLKKYQYDTIEELYTNTLYTYSLAIEDYIGTDLYDDIEHSRDFKLKPYWDKISNCDYRLA